MEKVKENDEILLIVDERKKYLTKVEKGKKLHTHKGFIELGELIEKPYGSSVKSNIGYEFFICKPTLVDFVLKFPRKTQIVYPKDAGYILLICDVKEGSKIVEIGAGSGVLTCILAMHVKPTGHVYSYEIRQEFVELIRRNLERLKLIDFVTLKNKNALEGIDERDVDAIIMDIPNPWDGIKIFKKNLKGSGIMLAFCPTINQAEKTVKAFIDEKFIDIHLVEIIEREFQTEPDKIRPKVRMIGHTGYLIWGRNTI